jgi:hypothetical protein
VQADNTPSARNFDMQDSATLEIVDRHGSEIFKHPAARHVPVCDTFTKFPALR